MKDILYLYYSGLLHRMTIIFYVNKPIELTYPQLYVSVVGTATYAYFYTSGGSRSKVHWTTGDRRAINPTPGA